MEKISQAREKTWKMMKMALPITAGIFLLIHLINPVLQKFYSQVFTGNYFFDPLIGALAGSVSFGIPISSYIVGGELLNQGVSLLAVTAFLMTWTTVGIAMLPLEIACLGKKFALWRNSLNFIWSILIAILTVATLNLF